MVKKHHDDTDKQASVDKEYILNNLKTVRKLSWPDDTDKEASGNMEPTTQRTSTALCPCSIPRADQDKLI